MRCESDIHQLRAVRRVDDSQAALAVSDDEAARLLVDADIVRIVTEIELAGWSKIGGAEESYGPIARIRNSEEIS